MRVSCSLLRICAHNGFVARCKPGIRTNLYAEAFNEYIPLGVLGFAQIGELHFSVNRVDVLWIPRFVVTKHVIALMSRIPVSNREVYDSSAKQYWR